MAVHYRMIVELKHCKTLPAFKQKMVEVVKYISKDERVWLDFGCKIHTGDINFEKVRKDTYLIEENKGLHNFADDIPMYMKAILLEWYLSKNDNLIGIDWISFEIKDEYVL